MIQFPRFRYLLVTPTFERGSPLLSCQVERTNSGLSYQFVPARKVSSVEFKTFKKGLIYWQTHLLNRGKPVIRRRAGGQINYEIRFSFAEIFSRFLNDTQWLKSIIIKRKDVVKRSIELTRLISDSLSKKEPKILSKLKMDWQDVASRLFALSIPFLFVDEPIIKECESFLLRKIQDAKLRMSIFNSLFKSPYVTDVVEKRMNPLPLSKEWSPKPTPITIPFNYHEIDLLSETPLKAIEVLQENIQSLSSYERRIVELSSQVFQISEEIHYVLGSLLLAGNKLWTNSIKN